MERGREAGVSCLINIGYDVASSQRAIEQAKAWEYEAQQGEETDRLRMFVAVGLHPHDASQWKSGEGDVFGGTVAQLRSMVSHRGVMAIGETGLDFFRNLSPVEKQEASFRSLLRLAKETGLPVIIHSRESVGRLIEIVREENCQSVRGVFHCFSSNIEEARMVLDLDFYIGITGNVTFPKADNVRQIAKSVPMDRLLIETDSPWLAPQAKRGKRNEPANVRWVAEQIAGVRGLTVEQIAETTSANASELFGL